MKIENLKSKYPEFSEEIDEISRRDPSHRNKYVEWAVKQLIDRNKIQDIIPTIELFDRNKDRLKFKDINKYELKELESELKDLPRSKRKETRLSKSSGSTKLYEDDQFLFIRIDSKKACVEYGKGTKWCITMDDADYYEDYINDNTIFYFLINKKSSDQETSDVTNKIAYAVQRDLENKIIEIEMFDSTDEIININPYSISDKISWVILDDSPKVPINIICRFKNNLVSEDEVIRLISDNDGEVRSEVAYRIDPGYLPRMMNDENELVRADVAGRIDPKYLPKMMNDDDENVRLEVAGRIDLKHLPEMMNDDDENVRLVVAQRIDLEYLTRMIDDECQEVRKEVVRRRWVANPNTDVHIETTTEDGISMIDVW